MIIMFDRRMMPIHKFCDWLGMRRLFKYLIYETSFFGCILIFIECLNTFSVISWRLEEYIINRAA